MPTYDYECEKCSHRFELSQPMSAEPIKICPSCQGKVKRLIGSGAGLLFKGKGFYTTDYRSSSYQKKADSDKKPASTPPPANPSTPSTPAPKSTDSGK